MPAILEIPIVIAEAMPQFSNLFANEPQRRHLTEYLTGLMVGQRKTINGDRRFGTLLIDQHAASVKLGYPLDFAGGAKSFETASGETGQGNGVGSHLRNGNGVGSHLCRFAASCDRSAVGTEAFWAARGT